MKTCLTGLDRFRILTDDKWVIRRTAVVNTAYQVETILAAAVTEGAAA
jgi:hypothetical protein